MEFSFQARVVFPVDQPPIEHGVVTIDQERILAVGTHARGGEIVDLGDVVLLPGFVNAHTHLEFSYLKHPLGKPKMQFVDWVRLVIAERGRGDRSNMVSVTAGWDESICAGVTTIADIQTSANLTSNCLVALNFVEVIGFSRARSLSALDQVIMRLDFLKRCFLEWPLEPLRYGISPHAPYTVSLELLSHLVDVAVARGLPMAMHLAESPEEIEFLRDGTGAFQALLEERSMWDAEAIPRGSRPLDYLQSLANAPRSLAIHGNYLESDELCFLAANRNRMSLVYCPRTHAYFGHRPYPLAKALAAGVRVVLGTDSRASNPDLSLLEDMRHVFRAHPTVEPLQILRMATLSGADALGYTDVGSITPGKFANLVAVPLADIKSGHPNDWLASILASNRPPTVVWNQCRLLRAATR